MILDILMQKEIEFIIRARKTGSATSAHAYWSSFCVAAQGHSSCSKNKSQERSFFWIIYINYIGSFIGARMTDCAEELLPDVLRVVLCVNVGNHIRTRGLFKEFQSELFLSAAGIYHAIYPGQGSHYIFLLWALGLHDLAGFESSEVLKGSHKTRSIYESKFQYLRPRDALQIRVDAILAGVKLRCSKPHEFILAWDKSGITTNQG